MCLVNQFIQWRYMYFINVDCPWSVHHISVKCDQEKKLIIHTVSFRKEETCANDTNFLWRHLKIICNSRIAILRILRNLYIGPPPSNFPKSPHNVCYAPVSSQISFLKNFVYKLMQHFTKQIFRIFRFSPLTLNGWIKNGW